MTRNKTLLLTLLASTAMLTTKAMADDNFKNCYGATNCQTHGTGTYYTVSGDTMTIYGPSPTDFGYGSVSISGYVGNFPANVTKVEIIGNVGRIQDRAFAGLSSLQSITLPDSLTSIGDSSFSGTGITSITIPNSVTSIEEGAFSGTGITSITIPNSVTSIGGGAFYGATSLQSITLPNNPNFTSIGDSAFWGASSLQSITIPDSVTSIGDDAFRYATSLQSITIPASVTSIGWQAFDGTSSLTSINFAENSQLTSIGENAFKGASALQSMTIPNSVTSIGYRAFDNAASLKSLTIPDSVTSIGERAFDRITTLDDLTISAENLQRFLDARGGFKQTGDINIQCTTGNCKSVLEAWDEAKGTNYASRAKTIITNSDGSKAIYDLSGKLVGFKGKRIYTLKEANEITGTKNRVSITYR